MWIWAAGMALATPYYLGQELRSRGYAEDHQLRTELSRELRDRRLRLVIEDRSGVGTPVRPSSTRLRPYTAASVLVALRVARPGVEFDSVVSVDDDGRLHLATVRWDESEVVVVQNVVDGPLVQQEPDPAVLHRRYLAGPLGSAGSAWDPVSLGVLAEALGRLTPAERAVIAGLQYVRRPTTDRVVVPGHEPENVAGMYLSDQQGPRIEVFDVAVRPSSRFVGSPWAPTHPASAILVHELGHALAAAARRDVALYLQAAELDSAAAERRHAELAGLDDPASAAERDGLVAAQAARNAVIARLTALGPLDGVLAAWLAATGQDSPTDYGRQSPDEGFAEAFMLHRVDPAALARAAPKSFAWFEATDLAALVAADQARVTAAIAGD